MLTYSVLGVFLLIGYWRPAATMDNVDSILHEVGHQIQEVRENLVVLHHRLDNLMHLAGRGLAHASKMKKIANTHKGQEGHVCEIDVSDDNGTAVSLTIQKCPDMMICDDTLRPLANEHGNGKPQEELRIRTSLLERGGRVHNTDIYSIKYCRPKNMLNFLHFWFPIKSLCSKEHRDLMKIVEECEEGQLNDALCVEDHICHMFEEEVNNTYPLLPHEGNLHEECSDYLADCLMLSVPLPEIAECMHANITKKLVCYGLQDNQIEGCMSAVHRCSMYENYRDIIHCGERELMKDCAELSGDDQDACLDRYVSYACKNKKQKGPDKRDCKKEMLEMARARLDMEKKRPKSKAGYLY